MKKATMKAYSMVATIISNLRVRSQWNLLCRSKKRNLPRIKD